MLYNSLSFSFLAVYRCAFRKLLLTSERLGAGGGYDTVHAGHKRSYSHCTFRGDTPPLAPNRQLSAADFGFAFRVSFSRLIFISDGYFFTVFSGCTILSSMWICLQRFRAYFPFELLFQGRMYNSIVFLAPITPVCFSLAMFFQHTVILDFSPCLRHGQSHFLLSILTAQKYANFFNSNTLSRKKLKIFSNSLSSCVFCFRAN